MREYGPDGEEFDEDLSELNEKEEEECWCWGDSEESDRECEGSDFECCCHQSDDDRSYDGSDADYYYELKERREEWKR